MIKILKEKHINVIEGGETFGYHLMYTENKEPFYVPDDKIEFEDNINSESAIILPISYESYMTKHKSSFYGFRLRLDSAYHITTVFGIDPMHLSWTEIQIEKSIRRFFYRIDSKLNIIIKEIKAPIQAPEVSRLIGPSPFIGSAVLNIFNTEINSAASWFLHNDI